MTGILKKSVESTGKKIKITIILIAVSFCILLTANILLLCFLAKTHSVLVILLNCITDILFVWGVYFYYANFLSVKIKLLKLCRKKSKKEVVGTITDITEYTTNITGLGCNCAKVCDEEGNVCEVFIYACGAIKLETDRRYRLITADNVVVGAEDE